jgi:aminopeptidase-like protein
MCILLIIYYVTNEGPIYKESFGMSPGTMDQLQSTHVPMTRSMLRDPNRKPLQDIDDHIEGNLDRQGLIQMTDTPMYDWFASTNWQ